MGLQFLAPNKPVRSRGIHNIGGKKMQSPRKSRKGSVDGRSRRASHASAQSKDEDAEARRARAAAACPSREQNLASPRAASRRRSAFGAVRVLVLGAKRAHRGAGGPRCSHAPCCPVQDEEVYKDSSVFLKGLDTENPHNDYCQYFVDSGQRPQNFIRESGACGRPLPCPACARHGLPASLTLQLACAAPAPTAGA